MKFSEANDSWSDISQWAMFLIMFGYCWPKQMDGIRRLILISMPCDSPGAGLIALGALRGYLEDADANDIELHRQRILDEDKKALDSRKVLLHRLHGKDNFRYGGKDSDDHDVIVQIPRAGKTALKNPPKYITFNFRDVYFEGEPCLEVNTGNELPYGEIYRDLIEHGGDVMESNLKKTFSGVCLAGRTMGENKTREIMSSIRFHSETQTSHLDKILSVHDWSCETISRLSFFNSRTKKMDRKLVSPQLVVADGDASFLKVLAEKENFGECDIIAIIDRTLERDRLEGIVEKMAELTQWYDTDNLLYEHLPPVPKGVSLAIWKKK